MRIKKLKIHNFKIIEDLNIDFNNINIFVGHNGVGKSTISDALVFMLADQLNDKMYEYIRWGQKSFSLDLTFEHENTTYDYNVTCTKVKDETKTVKTTRHLTSNTMDDTIEGAEAVAYIRKLVDPNIALYSAISKQHESISLLFETPAKRLALMKSILHITRVDNAVEHIKELEKESKAESDKKSLLIQNLETRTYEYYDLPTLDVTKYETDKTHVQTLQGQITQLEQEKDNVVRYTQCSEKIEVLQHSTDMLEKQIELDNKDLSSMLGEIGDSSVDFATRQATLQKELDVDNTALQQLRDKLTNRNRVHTTMSTLHKQKTDMESDIQKYNDKCIYLQVEAGRKQEEIIPDASQILCIMKGSHQALTDELTTLRTHESELSNKISSLAGGQALLDSYREHLEANNNCPVCKRLIDAPTKDDILTTTLASTADSNLVARLNTIKASITTKSNTLDKLNARMSEYSQIAAGLESVHTNITRTQSELDTLTSQNKHILTDEWLSETTHKEKELQAKQVEVCSALDNLVAHMRGINTLKERIKEATDRSDTVKKEIAIINTELDTLTKPIERNVNKITCKRDALLDEKKGIESSIHDFELQQVKRDEMERNNNATKAREDKDKQELSVLKDEIEASSALVAKYTDAKKILAKGFTPYVISKGMEFIQDRMNEFFQRAYDRYKVFFVATNSSVDFMYSSEDDTIARPFTVASGFEKELLSLSFRFALSRLNNLNFFILDEVDTAASDDSSIKLYKTLCETFQDTQLFCITHRPSVQELLINDYSAKVFDMEQLTNV